MIALQYWQQYDELLRDIGNGTVNSYTMMPVANLVKTSANTQVALQRYWKNLVQRLKKKTQVPPIRTVR
jgi:hypothetical protein